VKLRKPYRVECTLWGDDYVGVLPQLSNWLTRCCIIPRKGDTVPLPAFVNGALPHGEGIDDRGSAKVKGEVVDLTGVVTSVYYVPTRDLVKVDVKEARRAGDR
jgi:hypothetical protein